MALECGSFIHEIVIMVGIAVFGVAASVVITKLIGKVLSWPK